MELLDKESAMVVQPVTPVAATLSTVDWNENVTTVPAAASPPRLLLQVKTTAALFATVLPDCSVATRVAVSEAVKPPVNSPLSAAATVKAHVTEAAAAHMAEGLPDA